ncbi:MAG: polyprenyl synthetase family protein [Microbacteriaceae bacterium]
MAESNTLVELVNARIEKFVTDRSSILAAITPDLTPLTDFSRDFLSGGKRFRAQFCYWGWRSVGGSAADDPAASWSPGLDAVVQAATALELFHAAALIHDDIIDSSDTRRGAPSTHRRFEAVHREAGFIGSAAGFGQAAALLLGDLLLGWSDEALDAGLAQLRDGDRALSARAEFNRMRTEVTAGQYLDILEEQAWSTQPDADMLARAHRVIVYKSAKYSVEAPLALGASLGGRSAAQREGLREFGLPLGVAFQLRDDLLGVFGDPSVTGKPAGDDLREGKRTVLVALTRQALSGAAKRNFDALLGDRGLDDADIRAAQQRILDSGARDRVEQLIATKVAEAQRALAVSGMDPIVLGHLRALADRVTARDS